MFLLPDNSDGTICACSHCLGGYYLFIERLREQTLKENNLLPSSYLLVSEDRLGE